MKCSPKIKVSPKNEIFAKKLNFQNCDQKTNLFFMFFRNRNLDQKSFFIQIPHIERANFKL